MNNSANDNILYETSNGFKITILYFIHRSSLMILACLIITLNVLVMYALKQKNSSDDVTRIFICNLSVTDMLNGVFLLYNAMYDLIHFKDIFECLFRFGFVNSISLCSTIQLLALSVDRYVKILNPYLYLRIFKAGSVWMILSLVWTFCGVVGFLPLLGWRNHDNQSSTYCAFFGVLSQSYFILYYVLHMISCLIIITIYVHILKIAHDKISENRKFLQHSMSLDVSGKQRTHHLWNAPWWKPTKTVLIIIGVYIVCWIPTGE